MKKIIFISFLFLSSNFAQQNISIGFRDEIGFGYSKINNKQFSNLAIIPINLYLVVNYNISDNHTLQFRPGYYVGKYDFNGWEIGGYWNYYFADSKIFTSLGYFVHFNNDNAGGNSGGVGNTIGFTASGIGYKFSKKVNLDISYNIPLKRKYGTFALEGKHYANFISNLIKIGVTIYLSD
ncbi:MAG: hypothetical protein H6610_06440 [Ignavibacteriales bacterium]|nr:hypothetical protein [Ignavibacteriales bacterium]